MKDRIITLSNREIKKSFKRFISLLVMSLLGVGVFIGLNISSDSMILSLDKYYDDNNVYDVKVVYPLGLTNDDVNFIKDINDNTEVYGINYQDVLIDNNENASVVRINELNDNLNNVVLKTGVMPKNSNEILIEQTFLDRLDLKLNDYITIRDNNNLTSNKLKIVGTLDSPLYITRSAPSVNRGATNIGTGIVDFYAYAPKDLFNSNTYTEIDIKINDARDYVTNSDEYINVIDDYVYKLNKVKQTREIERAKELFGNIDPSLIANYKDIELPRWNINTRKDDNNYSGYIDTTQSIQNLTAVFPTIFFVVAIFMSIMCMNRMALEDRGEIGTLKSLGFSNHHIRKKYIIYSLLASIIGGVLGIILGTLILPYFIFNIYKMLYVIPVFKLSFNIIAAIVGLSISVIAIVLTSIFTVNSIVKEDAAALMRPKSPKNGKKLLIEKTKIWNRIKFSNKVTIRNIIRYKKRIVMTILGIVGCTILMLSGFGIRDAIVEIPEKQFHYIYNFDEKVYMNNVSIEEADNIFNNKEINNRLDTKMLSVTNDIHTINILVPSTNDMKGIILLEDKNNNKLELIKDKVIITDKLSSLLGLSINDQIEVKYNNSYHKFTIGAITTNYVGNYIYMDKELYEEEFGTYNINVSYIKIDNNKIDEFNKDILENRNVLAITTLDSMTSYVDNMLTSLDNVVIILIVLSGLLSFSVLYNLSYINISERKREIATLKVLGFYPKEVDNYIIKEMAIITIIGILIGLFLGTFVTYIIVDLIEMNLVQFIHVIQIKSYIFSFLLMSLFTIIVSIIIHFALKKIDMIESLKSVE